MATSSTTTTGQRRTLDAHDTDGLVVRTVAGQVEGRTQPVREGECRVWFGVPFGDLPPDSTRFRAASEPQRWTGVRDCVTSGPRAPQADRPGDVRAASHPQSERDCLTVNVWAPPASRGGGHPVLVWFHGGGFTGGSTADPSAAGDVLAAEHDVVVVHAAYRLGVLGALTLDHLLGDAFARSGSAGLGDQVQALRWVRENIEEFGGDPGSVTIAGESAGGSSVSTLLGTPAALPLVHRGIVQSGPHRAVSREQGIETTDRVLDALGLRRADAGTLLGAPVRDLLRAQGAVLADLARSAPSERVVPFVPVIGSDLLPADPAGDGTHFADGIDLLAGTALDEAALFLFGARGRSGEDNQRTLDDLLARQPAPDAAVTWAAAFEADTRTAATGYPALEAYLTDLYYRAGTDRLLDSRVSAQGSTSAYLFTWRSDAVPELGAAHSIETPFVFGHLDRGTTRDLVGPDAPRDLSQAMTEAWATFVHTGRPAAAGLPDWPEHDPRRRATMLLGSESTVVDDPRPHLRRWWREAEVPRV
ncbi:carboxylesterase type B [Sanguibacter keddieii DSM 10542]|uniref:Carboxylic ester hydrolase n=1 Tax=Sanguibacter keddieii (strain ATCC 51767 / DSM 10542 / NCFB 3025 / ST-74) TaxID=446469 RepID=D1BEC0_SANKS|nr:carboxylesterase family protein [Sanguibacter keddieii]ACZ21198.1 carboxylesterase type B [Sanguibacter keddieii DSM 10542]